MFWTSWENSVLKGWTHLTLCNKYTCPQETLLLRYRWTCQREAQIKQDYYSKISLRGLQGKGCQRIIWVLTADRGKECRLSITAKTSSLHLWTLRFQFGQLYNESDMFSKRKLTLTLKSIEDDRPMATINIVKSRIHNSSNYSNAKAQLTQTSEKLGSHEWLDRGSIQICKTAWIESINGKNLWCNSGWESTGQAKLARRQIRMQPGDGTSKPGQWCPLLSILLRLTSLWSKVHTLTGRKERSLV